MKKQKRFGLRSFLPLGVLLAVVVSTSGCVAVAAGAGAGAAVAYVRGQLEATLGSGFENSVQATNSAIRELGLAKVSERKDALLAVIIVRNAEDKKIEIRLENSALELTKIRIRVGIFGDEPLSIAILERIKNHL
jgi:hypothetical protein